MELNMDGGNTIMGVNRPRKRQKNSRCRNCCARFTAFLFSHLGLCILVIGYSVMGAFAFRALEAPYKESQSQHVDNLRQHTVKKLWEITDKLNVLYQENWTLMVADEVKAFQTELIAAIKDGYDGKEDGTHQWSLPRAFLYSLTVITTIGYGNIAPRTHWGKIATVFYAIIGIPLMLLYLTNIGDILAKYFRCLYGRLCSCSCGSESYKKRRNNHNHQNKNHSSENYRVHHIVARDSPDHHRNAIDHGMQDKLSHEDEVRIEMTSRSDDMRDDSDSYVDKSRVSVPITLCLLILIGYISGGAVLFSLWENWGFLDGSYFCFVTLSTIGFGDLVPGNDGSQEKLVICSLYLLIGMALIAMCFNLMQEEVIHRVRNCGKRIGMVKEQQEEDDDVG